MSETTAIAGVLVAAGTGLLYIIAELAAEAIGEGLLYLAWRLVRAPFQPAPAPPRASAYLGLAAVGAAVGALSYAARSARLLPDPGPRGLSLIIAPLLMGLAMEQVGRFARRKGRPVPLLASFAGGAICAFAMATARYLLFFR